MNQFDLNRLFNDLDNFLSVGRDQDDPKRLRANDFMLLSIEDGGVAVFRHMSSGLKLFFDWRHKKIVDQIGGKL